MKASSWRNSRQQKASDGVQFDGVEVLAGGAILVASQADSSLYVFSGGTSRPVVRTAGRPADVAVKWWQYAEVGTYPGQVTLSDPTSLATSFRVPADATPGQTIHLILEATDNGVPALTRYQRVIVTVTR